MLAESTRTNMLLRTTAFHKKNPQTQPEINAIEAPRVKCQATEISKLMIAKLANHKDTTFMLI
jgi:hypothetical protein